MRAAHSSRVYVLRARELPLHGGRRSPQRHTRSVRARTHNPRSVMLRQYARPRGVPSHKCIGVGHGTDTVLRVRHMCTALAGEFGAGEPVRLTPQQRRVAAADAASSGQAGATLVIGEDGSGKSTVVSWSARVCARLGSCGLILFILGRHWHVWPSWCGRVWIRRRFSC